MKFRRALTFLALLFAAALFWAVVADARVGGGHGYSGGSRGGGGYHSSGGYGGGGGSYHSSGGGWSSSGSSYYSDRDGVFIGRMIVEIIRGVFWLITHRPGLAFVLLLIVAGIAYAIWPHGSGGLSDDPFSNRMRSVESSSEDLLQARHRLEQLRERLDPGFSFVLFRDFLYALFSTVHRTRGDGKLDDLGGYLSSQAIDFLRTQAPRLKKVEGIVVGSMRVLSVSGLESPMLRVTLLFEANYTETNTQGQPQNWYSQETWVLQRRNGVQSRPPERVRVIACPACGAPPARLPDGKCPSCGNRIVSGDFDWFVESVTWEREVRPPLLTSDTPEEGTALPTLYDPDLGRAVRQYQAEHPDLDLNKFQTRVNTVFFALQTAWTQRKWELARPFESDGLFQSHYYWISEYKKQHLINVLKDIQIARIVPVKLVSDRYYASLTVRIYAAMIEYTQSEDGKILSGNTRKPRVFTEYWTFIRGHGASQPKAGDLNCPQCGAPLKINMAGHCEYCAAKVASGEFDWVLSEIEQDEAYYG